MALIDQYLQLQGKAVVGSANSALYGLFNAQQQLPAFHDVTSGNNLHYPATAGYDLASGIGTPDISNIAHDLALIPGSPGTPTPTPTNPPPPTPTTVPSPTPTNPPIPTITPTPPPPPTPTPPPLLIQNGGFEKGQSPWQESSSGGYQLIDNLNPHSGSYSAYLCGYPSCKDSIWQTFTAPASFTKLTVTYWYWSANNQPPKHCPDTFTSSLRTASGATIRTLQSSSNCNATNDWVQYTLDVTASLSAYKGKQVTLYFQGTNSTNQSPTDFFLDDVAVTVQ